LHPSINDTQQETQMLFAILVTLAFFAPIALSVFGNVTEVRGYA
jgi:hypothetical protein